MYSLKVKISFRAGHRLLPPYQGKCNNVHGEYFTGVFFLGAQRLDNNGMVLDFGEVKKKLKNWIDKNLDHAYIHHEDDEVAQTLLYLKLKTFSMGKKNPTSENIAKLLFDKANELLGYNRVRILEVGVVESSESSVAYYRPLIREE